MATREGWCHRGGQRGSPPATNFGLPEPVDAASAVYDLLKNHVIVGALAAEGSADLSLDLGEQVFGWKSSTTRPDSKAGSSTHRTAARLSPRRWELDRMEESQCSDGQVDLIDGRLQGQERYLKRATLVCPQWRTRNPYWDHYYCEFCSARFTVEALPDTLQEGYATLDEYHWVCPTCFEDFNMFVLTVSHARDSGEA